MESLRAQGSAQHRADKRMSMSGDGITGAWSQRR